MLLGRRALITGTAWRTRITRWTSTRTSQALALRVPFLVTTWPWSSTTAVHDVLVSTFADDKTLYFSLSQSIDVQKPELLMEQTGMSELVA